MTVVLAISVAVTIGVSVYMLLEPELKGVVMGVFLLGHGAHLSILAMSRSPVKDDESGQLKSPPLVGDLEAEVPALAQVMDPLPQALILTAIVIGFGVMGFLLSLVVVTGRSQRTLSIDELATDEGASEAAEARPDRERVYE